MGDEVESVSLLLPPVSTAVEGLQNLGALSDKVLSAYFCASLYTITDNWYTCPDPLKTSCSTECAVYTTAHTCILLHTLQEDLTPMGKVLAELPIEDRKSVV